MMFAAALLLTAFQSGANCPALAPRLTVATRRTEATRLAGLSGQRVRPNDISYILNQGDWRLVFATPAERERGVFVLRRTGMRYRLVEIWGGVLTPDERGQAASWARALPSGGVPARLANCMDDAIMSGR